MNKQDEIQEVTEIYGIDIEEKGISRMSLWHNIGSVRGKCGHKHHTISGLMKCWIEDQRDCEKMGGYSDRFPRKIKWDEEE